MLFDMLSIWNCHFPGYKDIRHMQQILAFTFPIPTHRKWELLAVIFRASNIKHRDRVLHDITMTGCGAKNRADTTNNGNITVDSPHYYVVSNHVTAMSRCSCCSF